MRFIFPFVRFGSLAVQPVCKRLVIVQMTAI